MSKKRRTAPDEPFLVVRSSRSVVPAHSHLRDHVHPWHQLTIVTEGLFTIATAEGAWIAPPSTAVWVPAHVRHDLRFAARSTLVTLYLRAGPALPHAIVVTPLLRELALRTCELGMLDERDPLEAALATLVSAELERSEQPPFRLPQPTSEACRRAASLLDEESLPRVARAVGLSVRTLERRFVHETGMTIGLWRRHRAHLFALEQLAAGSSVKAIASAAGYATPSAFVASFRARFGVTPARYFTPSAAAPSRARTRGPSEPTPSTRSASRRSPRA